MKAQAGAADHEAVEARVVLVNVVIVVLVDVVVVVLVNVVVALLVNVFVVAVVVNVVVVVLIVNAVIVNIVVVVDAVVVVVDVVVVNVVHAGWSGELFWNKVVEFIIRNFYVLGGLPGSGNAVKKSGRFTILL